MITQQILAFVCAAVLIGAAAASNAAHIAAHPVFQNVFGNFIENLSTVIYDNPWADVIRNPSLEKIENGDGEAPWWDQTREAVWQTSGGF